jgi:lipopolysaccharide transport system ATP-binding protein
MKPAIRVENLSKRYSVGTNPAGDLNLTESMRKSVRNVYRKVRSLVSPTDIAPENSFWAVKDVSFEVQRGEAVGIVGRNGAGKSTLFKLLSRITEPTKGRIEIRGRLGSLLEVGTGFHAELTGRENIYMNGSILGMSRREINAKFDKIVEYSEVGKFLDTPVKRYSSGMYVRLAFAVIAHLEPEILIIDEVLAVGDALFQKRCIDRMIELTQSGKTILFVSHNMQQIPKLCQRAVMLDRGHLIAVGPAADITQHYMDRLLDDARTGDLANKKRSGDGRAKFMRAGLVDQTGRPISVFTHGDDVIVHVDVEAATDLPDVSIMIALQTLHGTRVVTSWTRERGFPVVLTKGRHGFECRLKSVGLRPGHTVLLNLWMATESGIVLDSIDNAAVYEVVSDDRSRHLQDNTDLGVIVYEDEWKPVAVPADVPTEDLVEA